MSHFSVLVIGEKPEQQLAPYHEYECTGIEDEYVIDVDVTEETLSDYKEYGSDYENIDDFAKEWSGVIKKEDGKFYKKTNPNAKWDWYQLGGRWSGFFKLKDGRQGNAGEHSGLLTEQCKPGYADQCLKKDIDFTFMKEKAKEKATKSYFLAQSVINEESYEKWSSVLKRFENIDDARNFYNSQEVVKRWNKNRGTFGFFSNPEDFDISKEEFIKSKVNTCLTTYAFIKEDNWVARGEMGWFGLSKDEFSKEDWDEKFLKMLEELPEDTMLSIYDCHI